MEKKMGCVSCGTRCSSTILLQGKITIRLNLGIHIV